MSKTSVRNVFVQDNHSVLRIFVFLHFCGWRNCPGFSKYVETCAKNFNSRGWSAIRIYVKMLVRKQTSQWKRECVRMYHWLCLCHFESSLYYFFNRFIRPTQTTTLLFRFWFCFLRFRLLTLFQPAVTLTVRKCLWLLLSHVDCLLDSLLIVNRTVRNSRL